MAFRPRWWQRHPSVMAHRAALLQHAHDIDLCKTRACLALRGMSRVRTGCSHDLGQSLQAGRLRSALGLDTLIDSVIRLGGSESGMFVFWTVSSCTFAIALPSSILDIPSFVFPPQLLHMGNLQATLPHPLPHLTNTVLRFPLAI